MMPAVTETNSAPAGVVYIDPVGLVPHPLLAGMPPVTRDDPATAGFIETIRTAGRIDLPALLDDQGRILDGRRRRLAAEVLGLPLPAKVVPGAEAATVVLHCLAGRRNLTKGALAYLALPLLRPTMEEARQRWREALKTGRAGTKPNPVGVAEKTLTQIAAELGMSDELLRQAQAVHDAFEDATLRDWDGSGRQCSAREHFESLLFAGEIGLGSILSAVAAAGTGCAPRGARRSLPDLCAHALGSVTRRLSTRWDDLTPEARRESSARIVEEVSAWPEQVRDDLLNHLTKQPALRGAAKAPPF